MSDQQQLQVEEEHNQIYGLAAIAAVLRQLRNDTLYQASMTAMMPYTRRVMGGRYYIETELGMYKVIVFNGTWKATAIVTENERGGWMEAFDFVNGILAEELAGLQQSELKF